MRGVTLLQNNTKDIFWLDQKYAMNHTTWDNVNGVWPPGPDTGQFENLGGIFTSAPVAVALDSGRIDVFGLGLDYALYHKTYDPANPVDGSPWSPAWQNLGGNFTSTPTVLSNGNRLDIFGLGPDQAMLHTTWDGSAWSPWKELGGCFTTLPVVVASGVATFDIFARGMDFMLYHMTFTTGGQNEWKLLGGPLLKQPIAASAPAAVRVGNNLLVFAVGPDGALWQIAFDGHVWKPWLSLGIAKQDDLKYHTITGRHPKVTSTGSPAVAFVSEPSAFGFSSDSPIVATPPTTVSQNPTATGGIAPPLSLPAKYQNRVDVFCVGSDNALWHNWRDAKGWNGWVSAGGSFACAPTIIIPGAKKSFFSQPRVQFDIVEPNLDGTIHLLSSADGTNWTSWNYGPAYRLPCYYEVSIDGAQIDLIMSPFQDTDYLTTSLAAGKWPLQQLTQELGDVGEGYHSINIKFKPVIIELCEPVILIYTIVNSGNSDTAQSITTTLLKGTEDYLNDALKEVANPATFLKGAFLSYPDPVKAIFSVLDENEDNVLVEGGTVLTDAGGTVLIGSVAGAAIAAYLEFFLSPLFKSADGTVADNTIAFTGRLLQMTIQANSSSGKYTHRTTYNGEPIDDTGVLTTNSIYGVDWSFTRI